MRFLPLSFSASLYPSHPLPPSFPPSFWLVWQMSIGPYAPFLGAVSACAIGGRASALLSLQSRTILIGPTSLEINICVPCSISQSLVIENCVRAWRSRESGKVTWLVWGTENMQFQLSYSKAVNILSHLEFNYYDEHSLNLLSHLLF